MIGRELKLIDENRFEFCWIVDFPMFEWNEEDKKIDFSHNPFSMPNRADVAALEAANSNEDLLKIKAYPVRHRLQRRRAAARAPSAITCPTSCTRPLPSPATDPRCWRPSLAAC